MDRLLRDLMRFADVSSAVQTEPVDCNEALATAIESLHTRMLKRRALVHKSRLPVVQSHRTLLVQVFQNLIQNALKYCSEEPEIQISATRLQEEWRFSVKDNGIGIALHKQERIFGISERLHNPCEFPGTGLGLAICKRAVELCGGKIWVESKGEGQGCTFFFTVPAAEPLSTAA
jgi:signal transduction histidine kinase